MNNLINNLAIYHKLVNLIQEINIIGIDSR